MAVSLRKGHVSLFLAAENGRGLVQSLAEFRWAIFPDGHVTPFNKVVHKYDELPELSLGTIENYFLIRRQFQYLGFICFFTFIFHFAGDSNQDFLQCAEVRYPEPKLNVPVD